jgi:glycerophosphoryl diester phosphodiesterase
VSVYFWTINDPGQVQKLIDLGADGIMTDRPTMLREVLRNNNLWTSH